MFVWALYQFALWVSARRRARFPSEPEAEPQLAQPELQPPPHVQRQPQPQQEHEVGPAPDDEDRDSEADIAELRRLAAEEEEREWRLYRHPMFDDLDSLEREAERDRNRPGSSNDSLPAALPRAGQRPPLVLTPKAPPARHPYPAPVWLDPAPRHDDESFHSSETGGDGAASVDAGAQTDFGFVHLPPKAPPAMPPPPPAQRPYVMPQYWVARYGDVYHADQHCWGLREAHLRHSARRLRPCRVCAVRGPAGTPP